LLVTQPTSDRLLVQSCWPLAVLPAWVGQSHFAVGRFLGCVVFPQEAWPATFKSPVKSSLEFRLRLEVHEPNLAGRPQPADSSLGLSLPTAHTGPGDPLLAGSPARYGPPSGFGYPLGGLRPSGPRRFCFAPAALLGFALRSFLLPNGARGITTRTDPLAVSPAGFPIALWQRAGPTGRGFWVLTARESLTAGRRFSPPTAGCSLGLLVHRLNPERSGEELAGLCVHLASRRTLQPTAQCSLASLDALPQSLRTSLRCQAFATDASPSSYGTGTGSKTSVVRPMHRVVPAIVL
jgi:hypothetical protein